MTGCSRTGRVYEIPPIGRPLPLAGQPDAAVLLEEFAPTHLDAWRGRALVTPGLVRGAPDAVPAAVADDPEGAVIARAVVVRHAGDVSGRRRWLGPGRRRLDLLLTEPEPPLTPLLGVVIEEGATSLVWVATDPDTAARALSAPDWRAHVG